MYLLAGDTQNDKVNHNLSISSLKILNIQNSLGEENTY